MASGRLVLLQWCACRFPRIRGLFLVMRSIFWGSVFGFLVCVAVIMIMLVGPGLHFAPWPGWSRVLGLLPQ